MEDIKVAEALTYLNQLDNRIDLNDTASDMWFYAIGHMSFDKVIWLIRDYYANAKPGFNGSIPPLTPGVLKVRMNDMEERTASKQRALEPPRNKVPNPMSWRQRNPEEFDRLMQQGAEDQYNELTRRGIKVELPKHMQSTLNEGGSLYAQGGEL